MPQKTFKPIRQRTFDIIEKSQPRNKAGMFFDYLIISFIVLNVIAVTISSYKDLPSSLEKFLQTFEVISIAVFTFEYLLRLWTAKFLFKESKHPYISYIFSFMAIIDLLAILPFYIPFIIPFDLRYLRMISMMRLLRVFKLNRYNHSMHAIYKVLKKEKDILLTTIFITTILLLLASSLMYYVENAAQPEKFPNIVASLWWAVATLTTVGYGDVYPVTAVGKIISGVIAILGIGLVALPTGIISSGFITEINNKKNVQKTKCPNCGKELK